MSSKVDSKDEYRQQRDAVYTWFYYSNKPAPSSEIILQFKNIKKATVEKILSDLVERNKIFMRNLGKSKFYCLCQDMKYSIDESLYTDEIDALQDKNIEDKTLRYLKWRHSELLTKLSILKDDAKVFDHKLSDLNSQMSIEQLTIAIENMKSYINENKHVSSGKRIDPKDFSKTKKLHSNLKKEASARLSSFKQMIEVLCENLNCKKESLFEEIGIEE